MQSAKIILLSIAAAVIYGIAHDQITARVCVEYFTIGHPNIFGTDSPTLLAFGWGFVATWWAGVLIGFPLAFTSRLGSYPKRSAGSLVVPIMKLLGVMACCAAVAGLIGFGLASVGCVWLVDPMSQLVPREKHHYFLADLWAHNASYLSGFIGGVVLSMKVWLSRKSLHAGTTS